MTPEPLLSAVAAEITSVKKSRGGAKGGQPKAAPIDLARARALLAGGMSEAKVAVTLQCSRSTLQRRLAAETEDAPVEASEKQLRALCSLDDALEIAAESLLENVRAAFAEGKPCPIRPADLKGLFEVSIKMRRLLLGETTENVGHTDTRRESAFSKMPLEELRAFREHEAALARRVEELEGQTEDVAEPRASLRMRVGT